MCECVHSRWFDKLLFSLCADGIGDNLLDRRRSFGGENCGETKKDDIVYVCIV